MSKETNNIRNDLVQLTEDARALMMATVEVTGDKVSEARKRLAIALEQGRDGYESAREQALKGGKVADKMVHENPYQAIALGMGVGAILGYLLGHNCSKTK